MRKLMDGESRAKARKKPLILPRGQCFWSEEPSGKQRHERKMNPTAPEEDQRKNTPLLGSHENQPPKKEHLTNRTIKETNCSDPRKNKEET
jgi:hypothetical protein